jgi:hypothetical protein
MKIWKSENPSDLNLYCFYEDLNRLNGNNFPPEEQLSYENYRSIPFGTGGGLGEGNYKTLCQSDGIMWTYKNCPVSRGEISDALRDIGMSAVIPFMEW